MNRQAKQSKELLRQCLTCEHCVGDYPEDIRYVMRAGWKCKLGEMKKDCKKYEELKPL